MLEEKAALENRWCNSYVEDPETIGQPIDIYTNTPTKGIYTNTPAKDINDTFFGLNLSDIIIKTSIDRMILSLNPLDPSIIKSEITHYYSLKSYFKPKGERYTHGIKYKNDFNEVSFIYSEDVPWRHLFIIHDPTPFITDIFVSFFNILDSYNKFGLDLKVSLLELAWDFYTNNMDHLYHLKRSVDRHLFLICQRQDSFNYEDDGTSYTTNVRRAVKGTRTYIGPKKGKKKYVRLELELHRNKIRDLEIEFPIRSHHLDLDLKRFIEFRFFDFEKFEKRTHKRARVQVAQKRKNQTRRGLLGYGLLINNIKGYLKWVNEAPLMEVIDLFKKRNTKDYHHFLTPMENENRVIQTVADEQRFGFSQS